MRRTTPGQWLASTSVTPTPGQTLPGSLTATAHECCMYTLRRTCQSCVSCSFVAALQPGGLIQARLAIAWFQLTVWFVLMKGVAAGSDNTSHSLGA